MVCITILLLLISWHEVSSEDFEIKVGERKNVATYGSLETYIEAISDAISITKSLRIYAAAIPATYFNNDKYNVMFYDYTIDGDGQAFYDTTRIEYKVHGLQFCARTVGIMKTGNRSFYGYGCITTKHWNNFRVTAEFMNAQTSAPVTGSSRPRIDLKTSVFEIHYEDTKELANGITSDLETPFIETLHDYLVVMVETNVEEALNDADKKAKSNGHSKKFMRSIIVRCRPEKAGQ